jgi:DNA-binding response OmpR family regulator
VRVLVADDDPTYRTLVTDLLTQWNFEVVQAWEIMRRADAPSLVILDWRMPGMDGFEVAKTIRSEKPDESIFILLITGSRHKEEVMRVMVCGADDYLMKPFDPVDLKIHLRMATRLLHLQEELKRSRGCGAASLP